jgi:NADH-quinone oxidoreductase subunit J
MTDVLLGFFALASLVFAVQVITLRQPMRAALALIAHMSCLAAIFACLGVHVVALFQVLIYVGAVMVFMIYTIMLVDDRDPSYVHVFSRWTLPAIAVVAFVALALGTLLLAPARGIPATTGTSAPFTFADFSVAFMTRYWFHFELATVLLVVGVVATWTVISQRR